MNPTSDELSLADFLGPILVRKWFITVCVVVATVAVYAYYDAKPKLYRTTTTVFIAQEDTAGELFQPGASALPPSDRTVSNQTQLLTSSATAAKVARRIRFKGPPSALLAAITANPDVGTDFFTISASASSPQLAAGIANGFANEFVSSREESRRGDIQNLLKRTQQQLVRLPRGMVNQLERSTLGSAIRRLQLALELPAGSAQQLDPAPVPAQAYTPKVVRNTVFGALLALVLGVAVAYGIDRFDRRIRTVDQSVAVYGLPLLSVLPHVTSAVHVADGQDGGLELAPKIREPLRQLNSNLRLAAIDRPLRIILVTSAVPSEGKSTTAAGLAAVLQESGRNTAIIDCDLRRPSLEGLLVGDKSARGLGLTELLTTDLDVAEVERLVPLARHAAETAALVAMHQEVETEQREVSPYIRLLPSGSSPPNPQAILSSQGFSGLLTKIEQEVDVVILDTPPLLAVSDALALLGLVDGVVIVCRVGVTKKDDVRRLRAALERVTDVNLLGLVVNDVAALGSSGYSGAYYQYEAPSAAPG